MNCAHCQQELPPEHSAQLCPSCGKNLLPETEPPKQMPPRKFHWKLFLCALLSPALLTLLSAATMRSLIMAHRGYDVDNVSVIIALAGGLVGLLGVGQRRVG